MISVWENIVSISRFWVGLPKKKRPSSKSYVNVKSAIADDLAVSKLTFFSYVASLMEPYSRKYQSDNPILVFIFNDLKKMLGNLMRIIVKDSHVTGMPAKQLMEIDFDKDETCSL